MLVASGTEFLGFCDEVFDGATFDGRSTHICEFSEVEVVFGDGLFDGPDGVFAIDSDDVV